jgi:hypothetical protein
MGITDRGLAQKQPREGTVSSFRCPHCKIEVEDGSIPDHLSEMQNNRFTFECECGCTFAVEVDWSPYFYILKDSIVRPKSGSTAA